MAWISFLTLVLVVGGGTWLVWHWQRKTYITQYLFFLRYPILLGLFAVFFPWVGPALARPMLGNIFVLQWGGILLVVFFASLCSWAIVYTGALIWHSVPYRNALYFDRKQNAEIRDGKASPPPIPDKLVGRRLAVTSVAITIPLCVKLLCGTDVKGEALASIVAGIGAAWAFRAVGERIMDVGARGFKHLAGNKAPITAPLRGAIALIPRVRGPEGEGPGSSTMEKENRDHYRDLHLRALLVAGVSGLAYLAAAFIFPFWTSSRGFIPAIFYLLALFMVFIWALGYLSIKFDRDRVPIVALVFAVLLLWNSYWPSGHHYAVSCWTSPPPPDSGAVLDAFSEKRGGTLVVVAASGGGITAAYWAAVVLQGLGECPELKDFGFHRHVAVVSSVSGGSVGAMYYVDAFNKNGVPGKEGMEKVVDFAGTGSLSATTWGMAYPDFWRLALGHIVSWDRGWAQEQVWHVGLGDPTRTLGDWSEGVSAGWRPIQLMNATLQETGERLVIAPVKMPDNKERRRWNFIQMLKGRDLQVVTAARLSATFPYVSPQASPDVSEAEQHLAFHVADGGYYDNAGIVGAIELINDWLDRDTSAMPPRKMRIALVEIRAGDAGDPTPDKDNLLLAVAGPLKTLFSVRGTSQLARNDFDLEVAPAVWTGKSGAKFGHFIFNIGSDSPLSWQLTKAQKSEIRDNWPGASPAAGSAQADAAISKSRDANRKSLNSLTGFLLDRL